MDVSGMRLLCRTVKPSLLLHLSSFQYRVLFCAHSNVVLCSVLIPVSALRFAQPHDVPCSHPFLSDYPLLSALDVDNPPAIPPLSNDEIERLPLFAYSSSSKAQGSR